MNSESKDHKEFTEEECNLILNALLFSANEDMCANFSDNDNSNMMSLASKIEKIYPDMLPDLIYAVRYKHNTSNMKILKKLKVNIEQ
jgi:hypothetical protein